MNKGILLITAWFFAVSLTGQEIDLEKDLVALYLFEGNSRNSVEDSNHGIETNVEYENDRMGNLNSSISFTGNSSYVTIPHTEELNWDARSDSYSILFWVKSPDPTNGGETGSRILSKWGEVLWESYPFSIQYSDQFLGVNIFDCSKSRTFNSTTLNSTDIFITGLSMPVRLKRSILVNFFWSDKKFEN